jgi:hypothetical protein
MRYFLKYIMWLSVFPLLVLLLNISTDYRGTFGISNAFVSKIVSFHLLNKNVEIFVDLPNREIIKYKIPLLKNRNINKVVLGSSRALQLGIPLSMNLNNLGVPSALIQDYKVILDLINKNNIKVDTLIIDTNESLFDLNYNHDRYKRLNGTNFSEKIKLLFSLSYLKMNLKTNKWNLIYDESYNFISYYDGSISYTKKHSEDRFNKNKKLNSTTKRSMSLKKYQFDKNKFDEFFGILKNSSKKVNHITLYISPVPLVIYKKHYKLFNDLEKKIKLELRQFDNFSIIGGFNPLDFQINNEEFIDHIHLYKSGLLKIFTN